MRDHNNEQKSAAKCEVDGDGSRLTDEVLSAVAGGSLSFASIAWTYAKQPDAGVEKGK